MAKRKLRSFRRAGQGTGIEARDDEPGTEGTAGEVAAGDGQDDGDRSGGTADGATGASEAEAEDLAGLREETERGDVEFGLDDQTVGDEGEPVRLDRRGRPISAAQTAAARANLQKITRGRGRPRKNSEDRPRPPASSPTPKRESFKVDRAAIKQLLDVIDTMATAQLGSDAAFNSKERALIEPSLTNIVNKMTPKTAAIFSSVADPLMLGTGLFLWSVRVFARPQTDRPRPTLLRPPTPNEAVAPTPVQPTRVVPESARDGTGIVADDLANAWEEVRG